ncbi:hypothetical protein ACFLZT_05660 [Thermodesulfobacteriota bacterium]
MEIIKAERFHDMCFSRLTYIDGTSEEFKVIRGSIIWPHESIPGLILIGGLTRETEKIKILEELKYKTLVEAKKVISKHKEKYSKTLYGIYYQDISDSEGPIQFIKCEDPYPDPLLIAALHSDNINFCFQLAGSYLADNKLKVPQNGLLATQLQKGWENVASKEDLYGVIALGCLIAGIQARFESFGLFSEAEHEDLT